MVSFSIVWPLPFSTFCAKAQIKSFETPKSSIFTSICFKALTESDTFFRHKKHHTFSKQPFAFWRCWQNANHRWILPIDGLYTQTHSTNYLSKVLSNLHDNTSIDNQFSTTSCKPLLKVKTKNIVANLKTLKNIKKRIWS